VRRDWLPWAVALTGAALIASLGIAWVWYSRIGLP